MEDPFLDYCSTQELAGEADAFICTECGEGFLQYSKLVSHMTRHGTSNSLVVDTRDDLERPVEFALHQNGTLTLVERLDGSDSFIKTANGSLDPQLKSVDDEKPPENIDSLFTCERCGQEFTSRLSLRQHQRYHSMGQGYKCTLCCKVHSTKEDLREHLQEHCLERFYSCGHCGKRFLKKETLSIHQKESHESLVGRNSSKLEKTQENVGKYYQCKLCDLHFFWLSDLQSHLISHSLKKVTTENTDPISDRKGEHDPSPNETFDKKYRCGVCGGKFKRFSDLRIHHLSHEPSARKAKTFGLKGRYKHGSSDSTYKPFRRRQSFNRPRAIQSRSQDKSTKLFPCKLCHRVFMHSSSLSRHNRYHKGTMHACTYCARRFPQRCDLTKHIVMHHKSEIKVNDSKGRRRKGSRRIRSPETSSSDEAVTEKNEASAVENATESADEESTVASAKSDSSQAKSSFRCNECGKVFGLLSVYQRHLRYHKNGPKRREFQKCPHCRCRFSQMSALQRHLQTHEETKDLKQEPSDPKKEDDITSEVTDDSGTEETHGNETAQVFYECSMCSETFSSMKTFLQHQSEHK